MKRIVALLLLIITGFFSGCSIFDSNNVPDSVYIRIANKSTITFNSVYLSFPADEATFGRIFSGRSSEYKKFDQAYRYGYIEVDSQNETYVLQPIDYVGEEPLENGRYMFLLKIDDENLTLDFISE